MPLFNVDVTFRTTMVVEAGSEDDAYWEAKSQARSALSDDMNCGPEAHVTGEITTQSDLRNGWDADCIPYGGDGNTRIGAILSLTN